jgi:HSP20 family protein
MALLPIKRRERERGSLASLHDEMDDLFKDFFSDWDGGPFWSRTRWPALDIAEDENEFTIKAEVPGCKAEDIDISVHGNILTISGEKKQEKEEKGKGYRHTERSYGSFRRDVNLASEVDSNKVEATYKDGILSIKLPKTEKTKAVKIKVKEQS